MSPGTYNRARSAASNSHVLRRFRTALSLPPMSTRLRCATMLLGVLLAAGCSGGDDDAGTTTVSATDTVSAPRSSAITLRVGRTITGPWVQSLSLEHGVDGQPTGFYVCAAWDEARAPTGCEAASGVALPADTTLRLEQSPVGAAVEGTDSPGWATVGTSDEPELNIPLSDFVSGLDVEKATYRVTLRPRGGGQALAISNSVTVAWSP